MISQAITDDEARWQAVRRRDPAGAFFYAVATTGVYCRPSCPARPARRENVSFFTTAAAAERAGYRPCKRCRPTGPSIAEEHAAAVEAACRRIEESEEAPSLAALAEDAGLSPYHFHRIFKQVAGVTPKELASAARARRVRAALETADTVTQAIYEAGYNASSRFYEQSGSVLGMRPRDWRDGGRGVTIRFAVGECSLGSILVAATDRGVCAIQFGSAPEPLVAALQDRFPEAALSGGDAAFEAMVAQVVGRVEHPGPSLGLPLDLRGTAFQQRVWQALQAIPPGATRSYGEIAEAIGAPKAVRAVAQACAANPVAVAIPCHRVVRRNGDLGGYRWGVERKAALLGREGARGLGGG